MSAAKWELLRVGVSLLLIGMVLFLSSYLVGCATPNTNPLGGPVMDQDQEPSCHGYMERDTAEYLKSMKFSGR